jgi:ubiquinone biosynthesis protein COQ9
LKDLKQQLFETSLQNVHQHGWTQEAIVMAAMRHRGRASPSIAGLVTPSELVHFAMDRFHQRLVKDLEQQQQDTTTMPLDRIKLAIQLRLGYQRDYMQSQTWHQAMALGASPSNALQTQQQLQRLIECIVQYAYGSQQGQDSINELAKFALGGVYVATELHMLTDTSMDHGDTWAFLESRLAEWEQARAITSAAGPIADTVFVSSAVATAFVSGVASLFLPQVASQALSSNNPFGDLHKNMSEATDQVWGSLAQTRKEVDATDPSFYKVDDKSV